MNINNYNKISFGQKVPTASLLKIGSGIFDYNDAKELCIVFDDRFPGHVGYYKKAVNFAQSIAQKNENINEIFKSLNVIESKNSKLSVINKLTKQFGKEIDVVI